MISNNMSFKTKDLIPPGMEKHLLGKSQTLSTSGHYKFCSIHTYLHLLREPLVQWGSALIAYEHCLWSVWKQQQEKFLNYEKEKKNTKASSMLCWKSGWENILMTFCCCCCLIKLSLCLLWQTSWNQWLIKDRKSSFLLAFIRGHIRRTSFE